MTTRITAAAALAALAGVAAAQDSITLPGGLPGDALNPLAGQQCATYVLDLAPFTTSWGTEFGIGPIAKTNDTDPTDAFFNNLWGSQTLSRSVRMGPASQPDYNFWAAVDGPTGAGVNGQAGQSSGSLAAPTGKVFNQTAGIIDFGGAYDGAIGTGIAIDRLAPGRLYIDRRQIAQNLVALIDGDNGAVGGLSANAAGDFFYRCDGFGATGLDIFSGQDIFRTNIFARTCGVPNIVGESLAQIDAGATTNIVHAGGTTITVPNFVPGTNIMASANFASQYTWGAGPSPAPVMTDNGHIDLGKVGDHRGSIGSTSRFVLDPGGAGNNAVASFGIISRVASGLYDAGVFSVDATGARVGPPATFSPFPVQITDHTNGYTLDDAPADIDGDGLFFDSTIATHNSQTAFQGGVGQVAVGADRQGRALAANYMTVGGAANNPDNHMFVIRFNPTDADPTVNAEFALAAWTFADPVSFVPSGTPITDGAGGVVGELIPLDFLTGGAPFGPSFSCPAFDSAGNIWFQSSVQLFGRVDVNGDGVVDAQDDVDLDGNGVLDSSDIDSALIRAVYNPNHAAGPAYELELVVELGQVFTGKNSGANYAITFLSIADNNSLSSGTMFSSNVSEAAYAGMSGPVLDAVIKWFGEDDSRTNGGAVIAAQLTYDNDGDGTFDSNLGLDQDYNALMYIGNLRQHPCDEIDFLTDGILDNGDINAFIAKFIVQDPSADLNGDGIIDNGDIQVFIDFFLACVG